MFKNLYQKSKNILIGFSLISSLVYLQQNDLLVTKNETNNILNVVKGVQNPFPVKNKKRDYKRKR